MLLIAEFGFRNSVVLTVKSFTICVAFESEHMSCLRWTGPVLKRQTEIVCQSRMFILPDIFSEFVVRSLPLT